MNNLWLDMTCNSKELYKKMKISDKLILKNIFNYTGLVKYCAMAISRNSSCFLMNI